MSPRTNNITVEDEVREAIEKLKNNEAVGLDGISAEMLKARGSTVV